MRLKKRYLASVVAAVVLGGAIVAAPALAAPGDPVNFPDANLRACVNNALSQPANAVITEAQAASITTLDCGYVTITTLTGAQSLTGATALLFNDSKEITSLAPLAGLAKLENLWVINAKVKDLTPLSGLTNLEQLILVDNQVQDVSPLAGLDSLSTLVVNGNQIEDLSSLSGLAANGRLDASQQSQAASVQCGVPYGNPVRNVDGSVVPLTGSGYNSGTNAIDTSAAGTSSYTWITETNPGSEFSGTLTVTVDGPCPAAPAITSGVPTTPAATESPYSFAVTATGVPAPTFSITAGSLPAGLSLSATTGVISGTPTTTGSFTFTVTATNSAGSDSKQYTVQVDAGPVITSGAPTGVAAVGKPYTFQVTATGAPAPTFSVSSGALPDGLSLDTVTGEITGTPTTEGDYAFSISATNSVSSVIADYSITVEMPAPPAITSDAPTGTTTVGTVYEFSITASGAPAPTFAVTAGALPDGLSLDAVTGKITGTATTAGTFTFTVTATNSEGTDTAEYTIQVDPATDGNGDGGSSGNGNGGAGNGGAGNGSGTGTTGTTSTTTGNYTLASTGADILPYGIGGLAILLAGAALLVIRRRNNADGKA